MFLLIYYSVLIVANTEFDYFMFHLLTVALLEYFQKHH